jgi:hypothetical protein
LRTHTIAIFSLDVLPFDMTLNEANSKSSILAVAQMQSLYRLLRSLEA